MSACLFLFDKQYITSSSHHLTEFVRCLFRSKVCFWYQWSSKRCPLNTDKKLRDESPRSSTVSLRNSLFHNKRIRYSWQTLVEKCLDVFATLRDFCWRWPWELIHVNGGSKVFAVLILYYLTLAISCCCCSFLRFRVLRFLRQQLTRWNQPEGVACRSLFLTFEIVYLDNLSLLRCPKLLT